MCQWSHRMCIVHVHNKYKCIPQAHLDTLTPPRAEMALQNEPPPGGGGDETRNKEFELFSLSLHLLQFTQVYSLAQSLVLGYAPHTRPETPSFLSTYAGGPGDRLT